MKIVVNVNKDIMKILIRFVRFVTHYVWNAIATSVQNVIHQRIEL